MFLCCGYLVVVYFKKNIRINVPLSIFCCLNFTSSCLMTLKERAIHTGPFKSSHLAMPNLVRISAVVWPTPPPPTIATAKVRISSKSLAIPTPFDATGWRPQWLESTTSGPRLWRRRLLTSRHSSSTCCGSSGDLSPLGQRRGHGSTRCLPLALASHSAERQAGVISVFPAR